MYDIYYMWAQHDTESILFDKIVKARLNAVIEAAAAPDKKRKRVEREKCSYCNKSHKGGAKACRKRNADIAAAKAARKLKAQNQAQNPPLKPRPISPNLLPMLPIKSRRLGLPSHKRLQQPNLEPPPSHVPGRTLKGLVSGPT